MSSAPTASRQAGGMETHDRATSEADCLPHEGHGMHAHGEGCGHAAIQHDDHADFVHDGHRHAEHDGHWDEHSEVAAFATGLVGKPGGAG